MNKSLLFRFFWFFMVEIFFWILFLKCVLYCLMIDSLFISDYYVDFFFCIIMDICDLSMVFFIIGFSNVKIVFKCCFFVVFFYLIFLDLKGCLLLFLGLFICKSDCFIVGLYFLCCRLMCFLYILGV